MKRLLFFAALLSACTPPAEPPPVEPPITTVTTVPPGEPPVPPPEPPGRVPEDYFPLTVVPKLIDDLTADLQASSWQGWRDPLHVAEHCSWALAPSADALFALTHDEMQAFGMLGAELDGEGAGFVARLPTVNKRCEQSHREYNLRFCGRSDVLRARLSEFRTRLEEHLAAASELRDALKNQPGYGVEWNSIKGFCEGQQ